MALAHGLFDTQRIERMVLRSIAGEFFQLPLPPEPGKDEDPGGTEKRKRGKTMAIHDDLDQLLKNLKLKKIREILPRELEHAVKNDADCAEFLSRLLREEYHYRQERSVEYRIQQARSSPNGGPWRPSRSTSNPASSRESSRPSHDWTSSPRPRTSS